ncbi:MAG: aminotransferase class I/II-fold pyridoxal phosphate-dependent enzyme [Kiloniellales bacterium]|nr:aminotransferase class I/II-fold pyridoxal phosphate-dependent enzyme [Kiloniellales bacterium]
MALKIARRALVPPFIVMDVLRAANDREAAGEEVLHLEVGQPGTPAPAPVRAAAAAALETAKIGYTDALGLRSLRARIARSYAELYGVELDPARVVVTTGSSGGFLLSFLASFEPGDRVALAAPGYPAYRNILASLGVEPVLLPCDLEHRFQPTADLLDRVAEPLDGLILASPSNPTGTMLERSALTNLVDYCASRRLRLISDEIYHGIAYEAPAVSALELTDRAIVINSFSKYYSMTGWRLGWMVLPEDLLRPVECLAQNLFISPPTLSQIAAEAAFDCREELDGYVAAYARNRALLLGELPKAGFDRLAPADGAFYLYADVSRLTNDSEDFCRRMLAETGVAITPGIDFDPERGHRFVRFSFAGLEAEMAEAAERLAAWLKG